MLSPTLLLSLFACSDFNLTPNVEVTEPLSTYGSISGRVCDPSGFTWLQGAIVYVNLIDKWDRVYDVKSTTTDADGYWFLEEVPAGTNHQVFVQNGAEVIEQHVVDVIAEEETLVQARECVDPSVLDIAVITGDYDEFEAGLAEIGVPAFAVIDGKSRTELESFLLDLKSLQSYDLIFVNGGHIENGIIYDTEDPKNPVPGMVLDNIRTFVAGGGNLYVSDWAYDLVEQAWPEKIEFYGLDSVPDLAQVGSPQTVYAEISNEIMASFLDDSDGVVPVIYDLPVWPLMLEVSATTSSHIAGTVLYKEGAVDVEQPFAPLLVSFNGGGGKVIFSSFRLSANMDPEMLTIMQYVMFEL